MNEAAIAECVRELTEFYPSTRVHGEGATTYLWVPAVDLPKGCQPASTDVLIQLSPGNSRPIVYVRPGIRTSGGANPRSTSPVLVLGESWMQFSYQFLWDENRDGLLRFVGSALQRFAKNE